VRYYKLPMAWVRGIVIEQTARFNPAYDQCYLAFNVTFPAISFKYVSGSGNLGFGCRPWHGHNGMSGWRF
jgi:hypothetical protein